ncbi:hypothetical protein [Nakamurella lactea]|uniref:hypothetical protein n=1 Tax=Nakamurella lactea TaxID=459515 RepID=UPI0012B5E5DE|nr:hypothetical protein [Nakamurella lactea]
MGRQRLCLVACLVIAGSIVAAPVVAGAIRATCPTGMEPQANGGCAVAGSSVDARKLLNSNDFASTIRFLRTSDGSIILAGGSTDGKGHIDAGQSGPKVVDPCTYRTATNVEDGDPRLKGHRANDGYVVTPFCPQALDIGNQELTEIQQEESVFVANGAPAPPPPPPPNPEDLAEEATALLPIPAPEPHLGPDAEQAIVHRPLWMWVTDPTTGQAPTDLTSSVALRGVQVDAVATLQKTTWDMGEPIDRPTGLRQQQHASVSCDGAGTAPPDTDAQPTDPSASVGDCSYEFIWKSSCERTGNRGSWTVTARATWQVTWTSNVGVGGTTTLQTSGTTAVEVGELRGVLVDSPNSPLPATTKRC